MSKSIAEWESFGSLLHKVMAMWRQTNKKKLIKSNNLRMWVMGNKMK